MSQEIKKNIARIEQELADMKARLAKEEAAAKSPWPSKIEAGMIFKHCHCGFFVASYPLHKEGNVDDLVLTSIDVNDPLVKSGTWAGRHGFKGQEHEFEYIPEAKTLVFATGEALVGKKCILSTGTHTTINTPTEYNIFQGYSWGSKDTWYKNVIPLDALS